jgi:hypothetical protein
LDEALAVGPAAREYASALADYVYGVLAKDGAGQTSLPFVAFLDRFKRSLAVVGAFDRPLAAAVASCIRFNVNDFRGQWKPSQVLILDRAFWIFRERAIGRAPGHPPQPTAQAGSDIPLCPVDTVTLTILDMAADSQPPKIRTLRALTSRRDLSDEDHVKAWVLLAARVTDLMPEDVAACRAALEFDPVFGRWADGALRGLNA